MLMSPKFKAVVNESNGNDVIFSRSGIASKLILPANLTDRMTYDANIGNDNSIELTEGDSVYILTEKLGFLGGKDTEVEANIFFVDGGFALELIRGTVVLEGDNGVVYSVDESGEIDYPDETDAIGWQTAGSIFTIAQSVTKYRYTIPQESTRDYLNNLVINVLFHYEKVFTTTNGKRVVDYVFKTQLMDYYEDLGLGIFQFINYGETNAFNETDEEGFVDINELEDIDDEDEEDEDNPFDDEEEEAF